MIKPEDAKIASFRPAELERLTGGNA